MKKVWETKDPTKKDKKLSPKQKASAKAMAKAAGRPYPNDDGLLLKALGLLF